MDIRGCGWKADLALAVALASAAGPLAAQEAVVQPGLPRAVAEEVIAAYNDPGIVRLAAPASVPAGSVIVGDVGVLGGPLTLAGEIRGGLIVVNGDIAFAAAGHVTGDVLVIGGDVSGQTPASVGGTLAIYGGTLAYQRRGEGIEASHPDESEHPLSTDFGPGISHFTIRAGTSYNRVEGLPVMFGPVVETRGEHPLRVEALGVWRTESGLSLDNEELGYRLRTEQVFGTARTLAVGFTLHSEVRPIEEGGLSDLETSLSTFFLHKDYRDHVEREGWSVYARAEQPSGGLEVSVAYADENHAFAPVGSPWTLTRNAEPWRPQPLVGVGDLRTLTGELVHDGRNDPFNPTDGWYARARVTRAVSGELRLPPYGSVAGPVADEPVPVASDFTSGLLDLRRHLRVNPDADIALRLVAAGALGGVRLPPQFQRTLGGPGTLPGYGLFALDCGARTRVFRVPRQPEDDEPPVEPVFATYGCDRTLLAQAQYRGHLSFDLDFLDGRDDEVDDWDWYPAVDLSPSWVAFANAGRGWVVGSEAGGVPGVARTDSETLVDVGVGFFLGDLGLMWAVPLTGEASGVNFSVRLTRRF